MGYFGCDLLWIEKNQGEPFPESETKPPNNKIDLLHEQEDWTLNEMVEMTKGVLESDTVYRNALSSNIRAFHKAVTEESEMDSVKKELAIAKVERKEMSDRMERMEQLLFSLGATLPQKRDEAANS